MLLGCRPGCTTWAMSTATQVLPASVQQTLHSLLLPVALGGVLPAVRCSALCLLPGTANQEAAEYPPKRLEACRASTSAADLTPAHRPSISGDTVCQSGPHTHRVADTPSPCLAIS